MFDEFIKHCNIRHHELDFNRLTDKKAALSQLFEEIYRMVKENGGSHLTCEIFEDTLENTPQQVEENKSSKPPLNLVLCGSDETVRASISDLVLGQREQRAESSSVCVRRAREVCGHLLTLVEMPALYNTQLSEEEVMHQTLHCVSLCHPGVHAFLFIIPEEYFTDEDKAEMMIIQRIFSSRVNEHTIVFINKEPQKELDECTDEMVKSCGGHLFGFRADVRGVIDCVMKLLNKNHGSQFTTVMYAEALIESQLNSKGSSKVSDSTRIVLLGKTGVGKSATGNTILGKNLFKEDIGGSVTVVCQKESANINGREITVVDTPGLFDTNKSNMETTKEITKCISMAAPGPHVFLLVLSVGTRFTEEERNTVNLIQQTFGEQSKLYTIIVFSRGDSLQGSTIEQYIEKSGAGMRNLIHECGNRYHVLNNNESNDSSQATALLDKIDSMIAVNGGSSYTNKMFQQVEKEIQKRQDRILMERKKQIEREKEELKAKYEEKMKSIRKEMEEQKERQKAEERRREETFKERERKLKTEMEEREMQDKEYYRKRKEEYEKCIEEKTAEINREREENKKQWERQREEDQKHRDRQDEERRKREQEWKKSQIEEREKFKQEKEDMKKNEEEKLKKLQLEIEQKTAEEERKKADLEQKIRHAEESKKQELQMQKLQQEQEWEMWIKEEERKRKQQQMDWEKRMMDMEDEWKMQQKNKEEQHEQNRQKELEQKNLELQGRKVKEEQEKKRIEDEANERIRIMKEQMEAQKVKEKRERKEKDEQHKKELKEQLEMHMEASRKQREEEEKIRSEKEWRNLAFIKEIHEREKEKLERETQLQARKQAEEEFNNKLDEKVKEAKKKGFEEGCAKVESERTIPGKQVDRFVHWVFG